MSFAYCINTKIIFEIKLSGRINTISAFNHEYIGIQIWRLLTVYHLVMHNKNTW